MSRRATAALCLLALILHFVPQHTDAENEHTDNRAVWDGGGCYSPQDSQCQQVSGTTEEGGETTTTLLVGGDTTTPKPAGGDTTTTQPAGGDTTTTLPSAGDTTTQPAIEDTSTVIQTSTISPSTVVTCLHGGSWNGQVCVCPSGFTGDRCELQIEVICQNGGLWDGLKCQCTSLFYGPRCEDVVESIEIEQTVSASVEVSVTVTSEEYSDQLQNRSSQEFKNFRDKFTEQMKIIYEGIPGYEGVVIKSLRHGSVVVDYDVILKIDYTQEYQETFKTISEEVKEKIEYATQSQIQEENKDCSALLCFNSTATKVQDVTVENPEETCQKEAGDEYGKYFTMEYKDDKLYCVMPCVSGFNASLDCHNGKCQLQRSGPRCLCLTTDTHWYSGETCDWGIQKSLVYGLVGAGVAVLLLILGIFIVFSVYYRRKAERQKSRVSQLYKWNEEEGRSSPGSFQNVGFDVREEREDYVHLGSMYSNFQPSLNNVDPERKIRIQRPQVVMTSL